MSFNLLSFDLFKKLFAICNQKDGKSSLLEKQEKVQNQGLGRIW